MKMVFTIKPEMAADVDELLSKHNIRNIFQPRWIGNKVHYSVEADTVQQINAYHRDLEPIQAQYNKGFKLTPQAWFFIGVVCGITGCILFDLTMGAA